MDNSSGNTDVVKVFDLNPNPTLWQGGETLWRSHKLGFSGKMAPTEYGDGTHQFFDRIAGRIDQLDAEGLQTVVARLVMRA